MLWMRTPEKVYFKKGCMPVALDELGTVMGKKRCFIVTDSSSTRMATPNRSKINWIRWASFIHASLM